MTRRKNVTIINDELAQELPCNACGSPERLALVYAVAMAVKAADLLEAKPNTKPFYTGVVELIDATAAFHRQIEKLPPATAKAMVAGMHAAYAKSGTR